MRRFRRTGGGRPGGGGGVAAAAAVDEFIHRAEMDRAIGDAIFQRIVPTGVLGVAAAGHQAVIADERKGIGAAGRIVGEHRIGAESALTTEGQRAEVPRRYTAIEFVVEDLAGARAVAGERIAAPGEAGVAGVGGRHVGELAGLRIDAGRGVEHNGPAGQKLFLALEAQTRLRQVVRRKEELRMVAVPVDQRFALIIIAVFRQAVADPARAGVIRAVQGDAVPRQRAIGDEDTPGRSRRLRGWAARRAPACSSGDRRPARSPSARRSLRRPTEAISTKSYCAPSFAPAMDASAIFL